MGMKKTLLIVEDNLILCDILERWLQKAGYGVLTAIDEPSARRKIKGNNVALVLTDVRLPEGDGISLLEWSISQGLHIPFVVMTEHASIADAVRAVKLGAKDYLPKPVHEELLMELLRGLIGLPVSIPPKKSLMKRLSGAIRETERIACRVAPLNCSVMILGPNGSGKESVAQLIQQHSGRKDKPFVAVNCGCIRGELAASEFFGHVQGAFTDAKRILPGILRRPRAVRSSLTRSGTCLPKCKHCCSGYYRKECIVQWAAAKNLKPMYGYCRPPTRIWSVPYGRDVSGRICTTVSPSLRYASPLSPNARKIYCLWLTSFVSNIQKRYVWRPPVLPNKPKSPCFPTHGRAMCVNLTTG